MREVNNTFLPVTGKIAIVAARFNDFIVDRLIEGAKDVFFRQGLTPAQLTLLRVPGAYEIPFACQRLAKTQHYQGIVALGAVIRGQTAHFEYVAGSCANGVLQASLQTDIPITFGVITTENLEQAIARAGATVGNKGAEAAMALLELMSALGHLHD